MAAETGISWADSTCNFWEGCTKVSPACDNCYAEARNARYAGGGAPNWGPKAPRRFVKQGWLDARRFQKHAAEFYVEHARHRRVFVNSLSDFFDNHLSVETWRAEAWKLIRECPSVDFMLLTKRPQNIWRMLPDDWGTGYPNVWLGTTVENQSEAERRVRKLLEIPARVHFLSMEPLLEHVDLSQLQMGQDSVGDDVFFDALKGQYWAISRDDGSCKQTLGPDVGSIDWIIAGGESGKNARPSHPDAFRMLRDQCAAAGIPFHFKQFGEWAPSTDEVLAEMRFVHVFDDGVRVGRFGVKAAGHNLDGMTHLAFPEIA